MSAKNLVGAATRYIAGRNAVQTVYWRTPNQSSSASQGKMLKVSKTFTLGRPQEGAPPPVHFQQQQKLQQNLSNITARLSGGWSGDAVFDTLQLLNRNLPPRQSPAIISSCLL
ncbi:hypothetical protein NQ317_019833 [Molorchus minor]|uniref:Uncharacterized protein n=1 Tax=Molorchus minor TaxID=1323400 RepID=A0ABQ9J411_9CUCU|nr:hypothetical protein NQ317_019833 [Molorchus minor]